MLFNCSRFILKMAMCIADANHMTLITIKPAKAENEVKEIKLHLTTHPSYNTEKTTVQA